MATSNQPLQRVLPGWGLDLLIAVMGLLIAVIGLVSLPATAQADALTTGPELFNNHCAGCHVNGGNILRRGKTLKLAALQRQGLDSEAAISLIAANGIGQMDGYADQLGPGGPEAVGRWVWEQAQAGWPRS